MQISSSLSEELRLGRELSLPMPREKNHQAAERHPRQTQHHRRNFHAKKIMRHKWQRRQRATAVFHGEKASRNDHQSSSPTEYVHSAFPRGTMGVLFNRNPVSRCLSMQPRKQQASTVQKLRNTSVRWHSGVVRRAGTQLAIHGAKKHTLFGPGLPSVQRPKARQPAMIAQERRSNAHLLHITQSRASLIRASRESVEDGDKRRITRHAQIHRSDRGRRRPWRRRVLQASS